MSNGEVRVGLKVERNFNIKKFKSFRIKKRPEKENLPLEKKILPINIQVRINSNLFYFGLPQSNITKIPALLPSLLFFTNTTKRGRKSRKFMVL